MRSDRRFIPVIDIFAGPGGLGDGFSAFEVNGRRPFRICLSVESNPFAHETLRLRSFFRHFRRDEVPGEYYSFVRGEIGHQDLFEAHSSEAEAARRKTWLAELGRVKDRVVDDRIRQALTGSDNWILMGGPPCQAYSIVGRTRTGGIRADDHRVYLYREYLRIVARHRPSIFVLENVPGLLTARVLGKLMFPMVLGDLENPARL